MRCAVLVRGGTSHAQTTARTFVSIRSGPAARPLRRRALRGSSATSVLARGGKPVKAVGGSSPLVAERGTVLSVSVPVHRRICRSRQNVLGLREARHQPQQGRKPRCSKGAREREPDHRGRSGAQAQELPGGKRGADHRELGDPHHVSAASSVKAARFRSCFGIERDARRHLSVEGTLDRRSARLSRGPRETGLGGLRAGVWRSKKSEPAHLERRRRQGCQRRSVFRFHTAEDNATA